MFDLLSEALETKRVACVSDVTCDRNRLGVSETLGAAIARIAAEHAEERAAYTSGARTDRTLSSRGESELDMPSGDTPAPETVMSMSRPGSSRVLSRFIEAKQFSESQDFGAAND
jgi:hypothetical protein